MPKEIDANRLRATLHILISDLIEFHLRQACLEYSLRYNPTLC